MGLFDFLFGGKPRRASYQGGPELQHAYDFASDIQRPDFGGISTDIRSILGQIGSDQLTGASREYMMSTLGGEGINPYEQEAFQGFAEARRGYMGDELGAAKAGIYAQGMGRGSAGERVAGDIMGQAERDIAGQGFAAQQAGLQRQYGIAQFAPQMALAQQQAQLGGQGQLAGLMQQGFANQMGQGQLMGQLGQSISGMYGYPQQSKGLLGALAPLGGALMGGPLGGALAGRLFPGLFGGERRRGDKNWENPAKGW